MNIVKCQRCNGQINKTTEEFLKISSGYVHKACEEQFQLKKNTVVCKICKGTINKLTDEYVKKNNGYIHKKCLSVDDQDKSELCNYICDIFHLKAPGPINNTLIAKFHNENGYSYKSMYYTLKYHFEVKKGSVEKAEGRIGIIPYVYDEAKRYYENLSNTQTTILNTVTKQLNQGDKIIAIKVAPKKKKKDIDLEALN